METSVETRPMARMEQAHVSMTAARTRVTTWLPLALCLVLTAAATAFVGREERLEHRARFANEVDFVRTHVQERMATYMGVLRAASGIVSHDPPSAEHFRAFVDRLDLGVNYRGTQGIGYTARLGAMSPADATVVARERGWNVRVWPDSPREEVHAIVVLEPLDARNRAALGYDMRTEPTRREAMDRARDLGDVALSGKVTLVQEISGPKQAGFLLYAPVYAGGAVPTTIAERRAKLEGYVYAPLRAEDLFTGIFGDVPPEVAYELYDGPAVAPDRSLYAYGTRIAPDADATIVTLPIAGRVWTGRFVTRSTSPTAFVSTLQVAVLGLVLCVVMFFVTHARERARERELRATAAALASEETARMRELFVGVLGHDLVNPLNAIVLSVEQLSRKLDNDESARKLLARVRSSTDRMTRLIEQTVEFTRARLGGGFTVQPNVTDLGAIVRDTVDEVAKTYPDCPVDIETRGVLAGNWDAVRLAQVVSNLVGNAVRYHCDEPVRVVIDGTAADHVIASVHNAGVIPASLLPNLFDPFHGSNARSPGKAAGLGLGLFITREIIRAHRGSIDVVSSEAHGTTFTLTLPRQVAPTIMPPLAGPAQLATA
jgi:signal transduction histidine kinase